MKTLQETYNYIKQELEAYGTIIVPETSSYISDVIDPELEALEYTRIPLKEY